MQAFKGCVFIGRCSLVVFGGNYASPGLGNEVCPCCQLTLAFDEDTTYMGYRKIYDDGRDSTVARSTDGGRSFSGEGRLDLARWDIDGCIPPCPTRGMSM